MELKTHTPSGRSAEEKVLVEKIATTGGSTIPAVTVLQLSAPTVSKHQSHLKTLIGSVRHEENTFGTVSHQRIINLVEYLSEWTDWTGEEFEEAQVLIKKYRMAKYLPFALGVNLRRRQLAKILDRNDLIYQSFERNMQQHATELAKQLEVEWKNYSGKHCVQCGRILTDPESIRRAKEDGLGPICRTQTHRIGER